MLLQTLPAWFRMSLARRILPLVFLVLTGTTLPEHKVLAGPRNSAARDSLVLCAPASSPLTRARAMSGSGSGNRLMRRIGDGRFFAPTRSAMFFSHPGDRCAWRGGLAIRG